MNATLPEMDWPGLRRTSGADGGEVCAAPVQRKRRERLYRTGDLTRWLANGAIEYLERLDRQVKVRGYRIELTEIEAVLNKHEMVKECVVLARIDEPGEKRLVAYVRTDETNVNNATELRDYLKERFPESR